MILVIMFQTMISKKLNNLNRIIALGKNGDLNKITQVVNQIKNKTWE